MYISGYTRALLSKYRATLCGETFYLVGMTVILKNDLFLQLFKMLQMYKQCHGFICFQLPIKWRISTNIYIVTFVAQYDNSFLTLTFYETEL